MFIGQSDEGEIRTSKTAPIVGDIHVRNRTNRPRPDDLVRLPELQPDGLGIAGRELL